MKDTLKKISEFFKNMRIKFIELDLKQGLKDELLEDINGYESKNETLKGREKLLEEKIETLELEINAITEINDNTKPLLNVLKERLNISFSKIQILRKEILLENESYEKNKELLDSLNK